MSYDKNGNIISLLRNGGQDQPINQPVGIDDLYYKYDAQNNQLRGVHDSSNSLQGFKDKSGSTLNDIDYTYDANGNMVTDANKGITSIKYNHLNLPTEIIFNNNSSKKITYLYNAQGVKLQKIVTNGTSVVTTDYLDGFQHKDAVLQFFPHAEGYVTNTQTLKNDGTRGDNFNYVFNYLDHLGNIRMSYAWDYDLNVLKIIEENNYYPFGLKHTNYNSDLKEYKAVQNETKVELRAIPDDGISVESNMYKYKYNGKELQDELGLNWYDYQARNYDPALGRWMNIDPLAEKSRRYNPYTYVLNNPVFFIDPDGMMAAPGDDLGIKGPNSQEAVSQLQASAGTDITITRSETDGNVTYTNNTGAPLTGNAAKLAAVIDDHSIVVNVNADNSNNSIDYGEAFMGNTVTSNVDSKSGKNIVIADQAVNTRQTASLDAAGNKPGGTILHGVVEASEGAKMSQASGVSSPKAGVAGSVYQAAHLATELIAPQPAQVSKVHSFYGAGTGTGARRSAGLFLGKSSTYAEGFVPAGTVSVTTNYYANGKQLDN